MQRASHGTPAVRLGAAAAAALMALSACGTDEPAEDAAAEPEAQDAGDAAEDSEENEEGADGGDGEGAGALDFDTVTVDGEDFAGASLEGEPAVMWFWAPWCTVCRGEASEVSAAGERYEGEVEFYGVAGLGEVDAMEDFVAETDMQEMTHIVDEDGGIWTGFGVASQPAFAFVRPDGSHVTVQGTLTGDDLDGYIADELLAGGEG